MTSSPPITSASRITGAISQFIMPIAESSTAHEQRELHQREREERGETISTATPLPTPVSAQTVGCSREGFHADDEEKAEARNVSHTPAHNSSHTPSTSAQCQGTSSPSSKKRKKSKKKQEGHNGIRSRTPSANPTVLERLKPALVLENSGSVARDHLASERTFLAYVRTSLALASTGVALVQLFTIADLTSQSYNLPDTTRHLQRFSRPLGSTTILLGIIVLFIGLIRYFAVQTSLIRGLYPTARTSIVFITIVLLTITVIVFAVLLAGRDK